MEVNHLCCLFAPLTYYVDCKSHRTTNIVSCLLMFSVIPFGNNLIIKQHVVNILTPLEVLYLDWAGFHSPDRISLQLTSYSFALAHAAAPESLLRGYNLYHRPFNLFCELSVVNCMSSRIPLHVLT